MASYVVSTERLGIPQSLEDVFQILERNNFIQRDVSTKMQKMVGFRNIAVHEYQIIDPNILKKNCFIASQGFRGILRCALTQKFITGVVFTLVEKSLQTGARPFFCGS